MKNTQNSNLITRCKTRFQILWQNKWFNNGIWLFGFVILYLILRPLMQGDVVQHQAPNFSAQNLAGETVQLADFAGKPVLIHFWATWCPICEFSHEGIEKLAKNYQVLAIATQSGDQQQIEEYLQKHQLNRDLVLLDPTGEIFKAYGARAVPADFIIDKNGAIKFVEVGLSSAWGLRLRLWWAGR